MSIQGLHNNPTPWWVYEFFAQGGGSLAPTAMGLVAKFRDESEAAKFVKARVTNRISFRVVNETALSTTENYQVAEVRR